MENLIQAIKNWFGNLSAKQKQSLILVCTGLFALLLTISVILSMTKNKDEMAETGPQDIIIISPIPAGELFIPNEPDFIPGVLLERDRRTSWTLEDAAEHWQDPLRFGEGQWRDNIETAIDAFLEHIP